MLIGGLQKLSLLDFPDRLACIVFTAGCNMRCPFCHNAALVTGSPPILPTQEVLDFLQKRKGVLDGVCISGGEPLLQDGLEGFIRQVRDMSYAVKLDTNGSFPNRLKSLIEGGLLDYIAMDIKNTAAKYALTAGVDTDYSNITESAHIIMNSGVDYEFRTTLVAEFHNIEDIRSIGKQFAGAKRFFLQRFVDSGGTICTGLTPPSDEQMQNALAVIQEYIPAAKGR